MTSDNGGHRRPTAAERHVQEVEAERNAELFAQEMRRRPKPRRSEVVFARVGANERDEFLDGCRRHRRVDCKRGRKVTASETGSKSL